MPRFWRGTLKQPFGVSMHRGIWRVHPRFFNRTILVKNNDVDSAFQLLNRLMSSEGLISLIRRTHYYEKPYQQRNRVAYEMSTTILNEDLKRKTNFLLRKNRLDAYPGQVTS